MASGRQGRLGLWLAGAALLGLVLAMALWLRAGHLLPGTWVAGTALGAQSLSAAADSLDRAWREQPLTLSAGADTWTASAAELGLVLDSRASARAAWEAGRAPAAWWSTLIRRRPLDVPPVWLLDAAAAGRFLADLAPRVEIAPRSAGIEVSGGQVTTTPAADGRVLDQAATLVALQAQGAAVLGSRRLALATRPVPAAVRDVSQAKAAAEALLAQTLPVRAWDPISNEELAWDLPPAVWGPWLRLAALAPDGTRPEWTVEPAAVAAWLTGPAREALGPGRRLEPDALAASLRSMLNGQPTPRRIRAYHEAGRHVVASGETLAAIGEARGIPYPWIQAANPGLGNDLRVGQELVIPSPDLLLPLPPVEGKRIEVSLADQELKAYENGALKWAWPVSTGIASSPTAPGVFQVQSHDELAYASQWDLEMPRFMGIYRPAPGSPVINGFHGFPTRRNGRQILWENSLGHPVTFGCILLGDEPSRALWAWAEPGTIVAVKP
jgi:LysM repeat protein